MKGGVMLMCMGLSRRKPQADVGKNEWIVRWEINGIYAPGKKNGLGGADYTLAIISGIKY